ncbi:MAG: sugar ABC transporter permease [Lachnospiraceae bacterium]|nr:sugar ABC transporter permease [Lachnospiraceae bacterium]
MRTEKMGRKKDRLISKKDITGYLFISPFIIGFIFLFLKPMIQSVIYSFHKVTMSAEGMVLEYVGFANYKTALFGDAGFFKALLSMGGEVIVKIVVVMFFSMFVAVLLNQKFAGRLFFRTAMFLPVIFGAEQITTFSDYQSMSLQGGSDVVGTTAVHVPKFLEEIISGFGPFAAVITSFTEYASNIFEISWDVGIQIILFIIGLQAVPSYLYEVCELEGATKWETFWKITFPMLSPSILLCLIYTIIDSFNSGNAVMDMIDENLRTVIHYACAQTWLYCILVLILVFLAYRITAKHVMYLD